MSIIIFYAFRGAMNKTLDIVGAARRDALHKLILENYKSINNFCTEAKEDYASIYRYIHKNVKMSDKVAERLEKIFKKPKGFLDEQVPTATSVDIPVIENIVKPSAKLQDILTNSNKVFSLEQRLLGKYNWKKEHLFMLVANDNSMSPIIKDGTEIMFDSSQTEIEDNKIYVVKINSRIYIRKLIKSLVNDSIMLAPENKAEFSTNEIKPSDIIILGRVVYLKSIL